MSATTQQQRGGSAVPAIAGPALMLIGMLMFSLNDAMGKWLVASYSVGQVILIRSVAALVILAPFLWRAGLQPIIRAEKPLLQAARVFFSTFEVLHSTLLSCICRWLMS